MTEMLQLAVDLIELKVEVRPLAEASQVVVDQADGQSRFIYGLVNR